MLFKRIDLILIVGIFLSACAATLYIPTDDDAKKQNTSLNELQKGRELYIKNCSSCHNLHMPSEFTREKWQEELEKMKNRAKLDSSEKKLIINYLGTNCKE